MTAFGTIVDAHALTKVVVYSLIAGVGISATCAIAVYAVAGLADARRGSRPAAAAAHALVATLAIAAAFAAVVFAIVVMTHKQ